MGEIAEYLVYESEYNTHFKERRKSSGKSKMNGIHKYLKTKGFEQKEHIKIINKYLIEIKHASNIELKGTMRQKCIFIQQDFGSFVKWFNN